MVVTGRQQRIARYRERLTADPGAKVFAPLADLLRAEGRLDEALELLEKGLVAHPRYVSGRVVQGRTLLEAGETVRARRVLQGVLDDDRENLVVLRLLAEEAAGREAWGEARPHLELLAALDPERWAGVLADLPREPGVEETSPGEGDAPGSEPLDPSFATMTLVDIYLAQGYHDKARSALERILENQPDRRDVAERLADLKAGTGPVMPPLPEGNGAASPAGDSAGQSTPRTVRRSRDKQQFQEWLTRLRGDERAAP